MKPSQQQDLTRKDQMAKFRAIGWQQMISIVAFWLSFAGKGNGLKINEKKRMKSSITEGLHKIAIKHTSGRDWQTFHGHEIPNGGTSPREKVPFWPFGAWCAQPPYRRTGPRSDGYICWADFCSVLCGKKRGSSGYQRKTHQRKAK